MNNRPLTYNERKRLAREVRKGLRLHTKPPIRFADKTKYSRKRKRGFGEALWNAGVLVLGATLLLCMTQLAGVAVGIAELELECARQVEYPPVHPMVRKLMRKHGVMFFDWHEEKAEFGFWRAGMWCPAR